MASAIDSALFWTFVIVTSVCGLVLLVGASAYKIRDFRERRRRLPEPAPDPRDSLREFRLINGGRK